jgi:hypothetical protein
VSRTAWIAVSAAAVALGFVAALVVLLVGGGAASACPVAETTPSSPTQPFSAPLAEDPSALARGGHEGNLLVGLAALAGGPLELAVVRAETPVATDSLRIKINGRPVEALACGRGRSRVEAAVLDGTPSVVTVGVGSSQVSLYLPARLPPSGEKVFARALEVMDRLRAYRFVEDLTSGQGGVTTQYEVQAPDRLSLSTKGFKSVIIGRKRWDFRAGRWESGSFPGLDVADVLMWHRAEHARVIHQGPTGWTELAAFGLEPVPAWFQLTVAPSGRVLEAEMTAPSHFMAHHYSDFNGPVAIKPPK